MCYTSIVEQRCGYDKFFKSVWEKTMPQKSVKKFNRFNMFLNLRLHYKLLLSFALLITLPAAVISTTVYLSYSKSIIGEMSKSTLEALQQTMQNIDSNLREIDRLYIPIITSEDLKYIFEKQVENDREVFTHNKKFAETIFPTIFGWRRDQIDSVYFFGTNGINLAYRSDDISIMPLITNSADFENDEIFQLAQAAQGRGVWISTRQDKLVFEKNENMVLTYARKILSLSEFKDWGLLEVNISEQWLNGFYSNTQYGKAGYIFITDSNGIILSHNNKDDLMKPVHDTLFNFIKENDIESDIINIENSEYLVCTATSSYTGWKIISIIPVRELYNKIGIIRSTIIAVTLLCLLIAYALSLLIANTITRPLTRVINSMKEVEKGNLNTRTIIDTKDEVGILSRSFNRMVENINQLIEDLTEEERKLRMSELKALQAQIDPHFLYNTLDSIYWMTKTDKGDNIGKMILALSRLFRLSLNKGNDKTTIKNEIEHVRNYLEIQKIRFCDKFEYEINVPDELYKYEIIKLIFQPLVENSLIHGFEYKEGLGLIIINGKKQENSILFEVIDNGSGIDVQKIEALIKDGQETAGYALRNVDERIKLTYGAQYGLRFYNIESNGSKVEVHIPAIIADGELYV